VNRNWKKEAKVSDRVLRARSTSLTTADIKRRGRLETEATALLNTAAQRLNISARAYMRTVKVARTIADLETSAGITAAHISEALAYRSQPLLDGSNLP